MIADNHKALIHSDIFYIFLQYCYYEDWQKYEKEGTAVSVHVLLVFKLLECRRTSSVDLKNKWNNTSSRTRVMMSLKRLQLIHK